MYMSVCLHLSGFQIYLQKGICNSLPDNDACSEFIFVKQSGEYQIPDSTAGNFQVLS